MNNSEFDLQKVIEASPSTYKRYLIETKASYNRALKGYRKRVKNEPHLEKLILEITEKIKVLDTKLAEIEAGETIAK